jgi:endonuclease/exonuclease/phosphatase family metal-dependent hydrolase
MLQCRAASLRVLAFGVACLSTVAAHAATPLKVMTYNIFVGGAAYGPLSRTVGVIQTAQADVIGIQEVGGSAQAIANSLGFFYHGFNSDLAIISRYPISQVLNAGLKLQLSPTHEAFIFDVHLAAYPYQPYDIQAGLITNEAQAIAQAQAARSIMPTLSGMSSALASNSPVFLVGDFNEPSHLDWTSEAAAAGKHFGMKVDWPASHSVTSAGMTDAFRQLRPDEVADPGNTWTPGSPAPTQGSNEVHDRIDFVYYAGSGVTPTLAKTLGYDANDGSTDIAIQPYPSDHRAVVVEFSVPGCFARGDINGDCAINTADWQQFRGGQHANMTGFTLSQALALGDLNGDFQNNHADFVLFKTAYDAAYGAGAFVAMLSSVPEPSGALLGLFSGVGMLFMGRHSPSQRNKGRRQKAVRR